MRADPASANGGPVRGGDDALDRRRTRRFEWCVRLSVFVVMALELSVLQTQATARLSGAELTAIVLALVANVVANINLINRTLTLSRTEHPIRRLPRISIACSLLAWAAVVVAFLVSLGPAAIPAGGFALALSWAALAVGLTWRWMLTGTLLITLGVVVGYAVTIRDDPAFVSGLALGSFLVVIGIVAGVWLSGWMFRVFSELDRAREDSARLAVAEERLRISRDLHDVFGRTMATVAVKSELAAELARRGRNTEAADEIGQVQAIADNAGREVRRVIRGYREADLTVELTGARSLLAAAGISCTVHGSVVGLDPKITSVLAWVIREAVTNLIKHSGARRVEIDVSAAEELQMIISNDGVRRGPPTDAFSSSEGKSAGGAAGQGLIGMRERVASAGGELRCHQVDDRFVIEVAIPVPAALEVGGRR